MEPIIDKEKLDLEVKDDTDRLKYIIDNYSAIDIMESLSVLQSVYK